MALGPLRGPIAGKPAPTEKPVPLARAVHGGSRQAGSCREASALEASAVHVGAGLPAMGCKAAPTSFMQCGTRPLQQRPRFVSKALQM